MTPERVSARFETMPSAPIFRTAAPRHCRRHIDRDETRQAGRADDVAQQRLAIFERARARIVAVEVEKLEGEIGQPVVSALAPRLGQQSIRVTPRSSGRRSAVNTSGGSAPRPREGSAEQRGAVVAVAAQQLEVTGADDRDEGARHALPRAASRRRPVARLRARRSGARRCGFSACTASGGKAEMCKCLLSN